MATIRGMIRLSGCSLLAVLVGCASPQPVGKSVNRVTLKRRALACLEAAIVYEANPVVRVEAVESLESSGCPNGAAWIRNALLDEHPAVRFAACVAVGRLGDDVAGSAVRKCLADEDASVRVAALFAQHRLGDHAGTGRIPTYLLYHDDVSVRRNAALLLGLLDEPDANLDDESAGQVAELTRRFAASGGAVAHVRHLRRDPDAARVVRIADGTLEEVAL